MQDAIGYVLDHTKNPDKFKSRAEMEAADIKAIVDFERKQNRKDKDWSFQSEGMHRLTDDFFLLYEYLKMFNSTRLQQLCGMFAPSLLSEQELENINQTTSEEERPQRIAEAATPQLRPIWTFFVALCHVLQQGENQLTGTDAFWLGLIDEVVGIKDLPSFRLFVEFAQQRAQEAKDQTNSEEAGEVNGAELTAA